jgi:hypothetical protein
MHRRDQPHQQLGVGKGDFGIVKIQSDEGNILRVEFFHARDPNPWNGLRRNAAIVQDVRGDRDDRPTLEATAINTCCKRDKSGCPSKTKRFRVDAHSCSQHTRKADGEQDYRDKCGVSPNEILLPRASGLCPQTHGLFRDLKLIAIPTRTSTATVSPRPAATGAASRSAPVAGAS